MTTKPKLIELAKPALISAPTPELINSTLVELCRKDFKSFANWCAAYLNPRVKLSHNFHFEALAYQLDRVAKGQCHALMINMPPRYGKSSLTSVAFPAYALGLDPTRRIIVLSDNLDLAIKLANDHRQVLTSRWYKEMFPGTQISRMKNTEREVLTTRGGYRLAGPVDPGVTGRGCDYLIFDDPINTADVYLDGKRQRVNELVRGSLSRLDDRAAGAVVVAMQRLHADDACAALLSARNDWTVLKLAAIADEDEKIQIGDDQFHVRRAGEALYPEIYPISELNAIKMERGSAKFAAEYQQCPEPPHGLIFKREWPRRYDSANPQRLVGSISELGYGC